MSEQQPKCYELHAKLDKVLTGTEMELKFNDKYKFKVSISCAGQPGAVILHSDVDSQKAELITTFIKTCQTYGYNLPTAPSLPKPKRPWPNLSIWRKKLELAFKGGVDRR